MPTTKLSPRDTQMGWDLGQHTGNQIIALLNRSGKLLDNNTQRMICAVSAIACILESEVDRTFEEGDEEEYRRPDYRLAVMDLLSQFVLATNDRERARLKKAQQ